MYSFYRPATGPEEADSASDVIERGVLSTGTVVEEFETEFASFAGVEHAVAVTSGSVALELALAASPLAPGDGVVVSPFNCTAVLYALRRCNLTPVFVDIDPETLNLATDRVDSILKETPGVRGLLLTPTYGLPEDIETLRSLAESNDLTVINDYCQAPGATVNETLASTVGDVGVCSFGATKPITTGEGGIVTTDDPDIAAAIREARSNSGVDQAQPPTNVMMSDIEAAIGLTQLERYPHLLASRQIVGETYREELPSVVTTQRIPDSYTHVYHRFVIRAPDRGGLADSLSAAGVETSAGITKPLTNFQCVDTPQPGPYPEVTRLLDEYLLLPMHPGLNQSDAEGIAACVSDYYA